VIPTGSIIGTLGFDKLNHEIGCIHDGGGRQTLPAPAVGLS